MARRRWVVIVLGVLLTLFVGMAAVVGSCALMIRRQVQVTAVTSVAEYEREAAAILARFDGVPPLIEDGPSGPAVSRRALATRSRHAGTIRDLKILVFSPKEKNLVRLTLPLWLLRMSPDGTVDVNSDDVGLENVKLSIADLEAAGPGPVFVRSRESSRVLVWTE